MRTVTMTMMMKWSLFFMMALTTRSSAFVVGPPAALWTTSSARQLQHQQQQQQQHVLILAARNKDSEEDDDDDDKNVNPYADPNYPDLEFINYADPEYQVDQGVSDEFFPTTSTTTTATSLTGDDKDVEAEIEQMREDRRRRNDEYQFQTYYSKIWQNGVEYAGDWTIYKTSTFLTSNSDQQQQQQQTVDSGGIPRILKAARPLLVKSRVSKTMDEINHANNEMSAQERIVHHVIPHDDYDSNRNSDDDDDDDLSLSSEAARMEQEILSHKYWPDLLSPFDFRGQQGIMVCGNAWTICTAKPLNQNDKSSSSSSSDPHTGPFAEYRTEIGIQHDMMRMCIKFDYSILTSSSSSDDDNDETMTTAAAALSHPPLHLRSMTVCRETSDGAWPQATQNPAVLEALFGIPGADGGLYDPPPVGSDEQASQYMVLDLDGHATVLFPYLMDQDPDAHDSDGWVTSLDWTPGEMRYQVDRKVHGGPGILGLRTLELSEVQSVDAQRFRPKDGGRNMRQ